MSRADMAMPAAPPPPHKQKLHLPADGRTSERNQAPGPLFRRLGANLRRETLRNARNKFFENLFLGQVFAVIDARGSCGRLPHFNPLVLAASFESVEQRK